MTKDERQGKIVPEGNTKNRDDIFWLLKHMDMAYEDLGENPYQFTSVKDIIYSWYLGFPEIDEHLRWRDAT